MDHIEAMSSQELQDLVRVLDSAIAACVREDSKAILIDLHDKVQILRVNRVGNRHYE